MNWDSGRIWSHLAVQSRNSSLGLVRGLEVDKAKALALGLVAILALHHNVRRDVAEPSELHDVR